MNQNVVALFDGKVLCPKEPIHLKRNQHYLLIIKSIEQSACSVESDSAFDISDLAVRTGIPDLATAHDAYLYGKPKSKGRKRKNAE